MQKCQVYQVYNVNSTLPSGPWSPQNHPEGLGPWRPARLPPFGENGQEVVFRAGRGHAYGNVAFNEQVTALFTSYLTECSAFCILYRAMGMPWSRASLVHMAGGPDGSGVDWNQMTDNMQQEGGVFYGVLANTRPTVLTGSFMEWVANQSPNITPTKLWVYNQTNGGMNFGVDWGGFAGEF